MEIILNSLFTFVLSSLNFKNEINKPELGYVTQQEIIDNVCMGRQCGALAYYDDKKEIIFLLDTLDLKNDIMDRSYVLHEMVHHVQKSIHGLSAVDTDCDQRLLLEREAYSIQRDYLISQNHNAFKIRYILSRFPHSC